MLTPREIDHPFLVLGADASRGTNGVEELAPLVRHEERETRLLAAVVEERAVLLDPLLLLCELESTPVAVDPLGRLVFHPPPETSVAHLLLLGTHQRLRQRYAVLNALRIYHHMQAVLAVGADVDPEPFAFHFLVLRGGREANSCATRRTPETTHGIS